MEVVAVCSTLLLFCVTPAPPPAPPPPPADPIGTADAGAVCVVAVCGTAVCATVVCAAAAECAWFGCCWAPVAATEAARTDLVSPRARISASCSAWFAVLSCSGSSRLTTMLCGTCPKGLLLLLAMVLECLPS